MAYKQLPIVQEEFATTKYANQIKDNFDAIVGGQILRESLTQLSNRLTSVAGQFSQYNEEIQRLITEFNSLKSDIDKALDNIDLRFDELSADVVKKVTTISENLKRLEDSTGYNTNLHQYFVNVEQARNLVLAINKLHEDLGDPRNLTTKIKENTVSSINELDREMGDLKSLTTAEKNTIVGSINELDREIGPLNTLTTKNKNTIVQSINELETELGDVENLTTANKNNAVNAINELDREVGDLITLTTKHKNTIVGSINELDSELGDLSNLTTTEKRTIVGSINELDKDVGNLSDLTTVRKENVVSSINELDREMGVLSELTTKNKNTIVEAVNEIETELGNVEVLSTKNKSNAVSAINELDVELGEITQLTTKNKNNIVSSINELDKEVGNIESIVDVEITASNLSEIINKLKELLGTFNVINQTIKQDNFVNTINKLYEEIDRKITEAKLLDGKNIEINSEKKINVLGGVTKDYAPKTKYYKNDFIWNRNVEKEKDVLYKALKDFTSTTFESDLNVNIVEVKTGSDITSSKVINTYKEETEYEAGDIILTTEIDDVEKAKLFRTKQQTKGVLPTEENKELFETIQLGENKADKILFKDTEHIINFVYDIVFPRYKLNNVIKDNIPLQVDEHSTLLTSNLGIKKNEDDGYYYFTLNYNLNPSYTKDKKEIPSMEEFTPLVTIIKTNEQTNSVNQASILSYLFPVNEYILLTPEECICDVDNLIIKAEAAFISDSTFENNVLFGVRLELNPELIETSPPNTIQFKIKERRRLDIDLNFLCFFTNYGGTDVKNTLNLKIEQTEEKKIKFKGSFVCKDQNNGAETNSLLFVAPNINDILLNYFNSNNNIIENCGSTDKSKQLKISSMNKNEHNNTFTINVIKTDNSNFEAGEVLNFEFEPIKGNEPLDELVVKNMSNVEDVRKFAIYVQKELSEIKKRLN